MFDFCSAGLRPQCLAKTSSGIGTTASGVISCCPFTSSRSEGASAIAGAVAGSLASSSICRAVVVCLINATGCTCFTWAETLCGSAPATAPPNIALGVLLPERRSLFALSLVGVHSFPPPAQTAARGQMSDVPNTAAAADAQRYSALRPSRPHAQKNRHFAPCITATVSLLSSPRRSNSPSVRCAPTLPKKAEIQIHAH